MRVLLGLFSSIGLAAIIVACGGPAPTLTSTPPTEAPASVEFLLASTDLAAEETRFAFALVDSQGALVANARVALQFFRLSNDVATLAQAGEAAYRSLEITTPHLHPDGQAHQHIEARGIYVMDAVRFDRAGDWGVQAQVLLPGSADPITLRHNLTVQEQSQAWPLGAHVPSTQNKTASDVSDLSLLSTSPTPMPELYQTSVATALKQGKPLVVVFATPAFCTSRLCGPVVDIVAQLAPMYRGQASFIHLEPYELDIARLEGRLHLTEIALQWRLPSEPFVYVVDSQGRVAAKFEGVVTPGELQQALQKVLASGASPSSR